MAVTSWCNGFTVTALSRCGMTKPGWLGRFRKHGLLGVRTAGLTWLAVVPSPLGDVLVICSLNRNSRACSPCFWPKNLIINSVSSPLVCFLGFQNWKDLPRITYRSTGNPVDHLRNWWLRQVPVTLVCIPTVTLSGWCLLQTHLWWANLTLTGSVKSSGPSGQNQHLC
jgi:hypothetical protein